jgi:hypothetical protein
MTDKFIAEFFNIKGDGIDSIEATPKTLRYLRLEAEDVEAQQVLFNDIKILGISVFTNSLMPENEIYFLSKGKAIAKIRLWPPDAKVDK